MPASQLKSLATLGLVLALGLGFAVASRAQDDKTKAAGPHGGALERTQHYRFEIVCTTAGIEVYPYGMDGKPLDTTKMSGTATFYHPNSPKAWFDRPLGVVTANPGQAATALGLRIDLSKVPSQGAKVALEIKGLPDAAESSASFTTPYTLTQAQPPAPRPTQVAITYARATAADQPAINAQRVCKVSGQSLGSMGAPIKVTRGNRSVFLCCQACLKKIQANPDQYFGTLAVN